jgi:hypothetical protein
MRSRERKALLVYRSRPIEIIGPTMISVARRSGKGGVSRDPYIVRIKGNALTCPCPAFADSRPASAGTQECKHTQAVAKFLADGPTGDPTTERPPTYPQDWIAYKAAKRVTLEAVRTMLPALMKESFREGWSA